MFKQILLCVSTVLILQHALSIVYTLGFHKRVYNHRPGTCRVVPGINTGSEDIQVLKSGLALISSGVDLKHMGFELDPVALTWKGHIYLFDFNRPSANVTELPITGSFDHADFRPHGISVWEDGTQTTLFVVNHKRSQEAIEVFRFDEEKRSLEYLHTITDPLMRSVNDLLAVGPNSFYFTNDGYNTQRLKRLLEGLLKFPWGSVGFYDGNAGRTHIMVPTALGPNGINMSPDGRYIYISSPILGAVTVYERQTDNSIKAVQVIDLGTSVDNIYVDSATGDLFVGCHPIGYQTFSHFMNFTQPSSSQVLYLHLTSETAPYSYEVKEVYADDGRQVSGSSVAAYYNKQLLIGTVVHKMAYCEVDAF